MSMLDDLLKKSVTGTSVKTNNDKVISTPSVDNLLSSSKNGEDSGIYNRKTNPVVEETPFKKRSLSDRIDSLTARPDESELGTNVKKNTLKYLPSSIVENIPFGVGEIIKQARNEPEIVSNVSFEDVLKGIQETSKDTFKGLIGAGASLAMVPLKFKVPILGEVTNIQYNAAQRINQGDDINKVILEEGVVNNIFNTLMLAGLASEVASPRPVTIKKVQYKGETPSGVKVKENAKSFRLYEEPTATQQISPEFVKKMAVEKGVDLGNKYNPDLPTYFKITGKGTGMIQAEVVQVKPSYLKTFLDKFGMNINKTPSNMTTSLITQKINKSELTGKKAEIVPESRTITTPEKVEAVIPKLKQAVMNGDTQLIETTKVMAEETGDKAIIKKVNDIIDTANNEVSKIGEATDKINNVLEQSIQTPEKQLTEPVYEPYKPDRVKPANQIYAHTASDKFFSGTYNGQPYTTDSYIMEFNSDVKAPSKTEFVSGEKAPSEDTLNRLIITEEELKPVEVVKIYGEEGKPNYITLEGDGISLDMQRKYFDYFNKKYNNPEFKAVAKNRPVVVIKNGEKVGLIMPVIDSMGTGKKSITTWEKPKAKQPKLEESKETKKEEKAPKMKNGELGSLASPQGNKTIRKKIEKQEKFVESGKPQEVPESFKISERAKEILAEFGIPVNEKNLSNRLLGVYKPLTDKVRVQALYDVTTVTHEAIHAIDNQIKFSDTLIKESGKGANIRQQLTDIYVDLYPTAKAKHPLDKRIKEGLAVLFENYFYDPASITAKYPDLVDAFIKPEGKYYTPEFSSLLEKMNSLVDDYAKLSPEQRIGSRIRTGKEVVDNQKGFTWKQRLEFELFNKFEPLKRYGRKAGVQGTWDDPLIQAFNIMNKNQIIASWVKGDNTPILLRDGNYRIEKGTVKNYLDLIKGDEKEFMSYLVARRVVADNNKLNILRNELDISSETYDEDLAEIEKLSQVIIRDDFSLQDATEVVDKFADKFKDAEKIYDDINKKLIDVMEENDLIDSETAKLYKDEPGYTSFRRYIEEDLESIGTLKASSKSKVTSLKERTGSQLDIIDPIYSQITSINEVMGKALENRLWNKVADIANKNTGISQRFEKMESKPSIDAEGRVSFPQEKDPATIRIFKKGKREFYKVAPEFQAVAKVLKGKELDTFGQILRIPASVFTRLTTSANPLFAVGNLSVDQFSALSQTKTGFIPVIDPAKSLVDFIKGDDGIKAYMALGGKRQTLAAYYDLSPEQIEHKLTGGETKLEKVTGIIDSGIGILELPSNVSEIMTRYSEFRRSVDAGDSMSVAMYKASEVTTPFQLQGNIGGRVGQEIIKSIPYLNATIQVLYKFGRSAKDNPKRMGSVIAGILTAGLTIAILTHKYATEQQKRLLAEQPVRNLSRYIYIPSPNGESLIKFRIPEQIGVLTGMAYLYTDQHYGKNKATFNDYIDNVSSVLPEQIQVWNPGKMLISWMPQIMKPGVQVAFNKKTFPELAPIVPEYMLTKKPSEQYNSYTSRVAIGIGRLLNVSPTKTEFLIKNQFGTVGGLLVGNIPTNPLNVQEEKYAMSGRSYNRFYENREIVTQQYQDIKDNPKKYSYNDKYEISQSNKVYDSVSELLSEMRTISKEKDLPEDVKESAYQLLLKLDSTDNTTEVIPMVYDLKSKILKMK